MLPCTKYSGFKYNCVFICAEKIPEPLPEELPEPEPLLTAPAGGFRRPGRYKDSPRKGQTHSKGKCLVPVTAG